MNVTDIRMFFDISPDDGLVIQCGGQASVKVEVLHKTGRSARLRVSAPAEVKVQRVSAQHQPDAVDWLAGGPPAVPSTAP